MLSSTIATRTLPDFANANVWRAGELGSASLQTVVTGYAALDDVLPGGGWPQGALIEVLQPQAGLHEWGLVARALTAAQAEAPAQLTVLVGAPYLPFGPALGARQLNMQRLLSIHGKPGDAPSLLWATREALQCGDVHSVLAWLPDARSAHLRRLQIAAHAHNKLLFVFRPLRAQQESSPAPLRLLLEGAVSEAGNLLVHVLKRRGPHWPRRCCSTPGRRGCRRCWRPAVKGRGGSAKNWRPCCCLRWFHFLSLHRKVLSMPCWVALHISITTEAEAASSAPAFVDATAVQRWVPDAAAVQRAVASVALGFTPRVALVDEAVLMDVTGSLRLFGGLVKLVEKLERQLRQFLSQIGLWPGWLLHKALHL